ncbi:hypothetical protein JOF46_003545 [Paeniglutamicibacter psychrophenolicus]|uniref:Uncharacterized protein n=1 Tax=Paeniglutamicibacter psychrophenolicus TaxID=257454 RepID=A0ABS4WHM5_9MICC|nr:hypothetical protein [Paeniglutamicibacter psychrophenolicus]
MDRHAAPGVGPGLGAAPAAPCGAFRRFICERSALGRFSHECEPNWQRISGHLSEAVTGPRTAARICPSAVLAGNKSVRSSTRLVRAAPMAAGTPGGPWKPGVGGFFAISPPLGRARPGWPDSPPFRQSRACCGRQPSWPVTTMARWRQQRSRLPWRRRPKPEAPSRPGARERPRKQKMSAIAELVLKIQVRLILMIIFGATQAALVDSLEHARAANAKRQFQ